MPFGDPGQFSRWSRRDQFTYTRMYDASHPRRRRPGNAGCLSMLLLVAAAALAAVHLPRG